MLKLKEKKIAKSVFHNVEAGGWVANWYEHQFSNHVISIETQIMAKNF